MSSLKKVRAAANEEAIKLLFYGFTQFKIQFIIQVIFSIDFEISGEGHFSYTEKVRTGTNDKAQVEQPSKKVFWPFSKAINPTQPKIT